MRDTIDILGVPVDSLTMQQAVNNLRIFLSDIRAHTVYTPNAEIMMEAYRDPYVMSILRDADMVVADGAGVVLASRIMGTPLPEKVSGIDLVKNSFALNASRKYRYFLFGSKPGIAEAAAQSLLKQYPDVEIAGCRNGYFTQEEESGIIQEINASNADILLVALGAPKQEKWIHENRHKLDVRVCIGVGGSLDVFAGAAKLAPEFFRRNGLEWLYRLFREPSRFIRMLDLPKFILRAILRRILTGKPDIV